MNSKQKTKKKPPQEVMIAGAEKPIPFRFVAEKPKPKIIIPPPDSMGLICDLADDGLINGSWQGGIWKA